MKTALRNLAFALGASVALAACSKDSQTAEDVLAEDSTLALEVMLATGDTVAMQADTAAPSQELQSTESLQEPAPKIEPSPTAMAQEAPAPVAPRRRSSPVRSRSSRSNARPVSARGASRTSSTTTAPRPSAKSTPMKSSATIPAGTELSLTSSQRVCASMSNPGDRFTARFSEDVIGPIGVVIPRGTPATAQIFSLEKSVDLTMQSISFAGETYSIDSDVTYTEIEKVLAGAVTSRRTSRVDHCVPEGGRITVRLTEPLKLSLSE